MQVDLRQIYYVQERPNPWQGALKYVNCKGKPYVTRPMLLAYLALTYDISDDGVRLLVERLLAEHALYESADGILTLTPPKRAPWALILVAGLVVVAIVLGVVLLWVAK